MQVYNSTFFKSGRRYCISFHCGFLQAIPRTNRPEQKKLRHLSVRIVLPQDLRHIIMSKSSTTLKNHH